MIAIINYHLFITANDDGTSHVQDSVAILKNY